MKVLFLNQNTKFSGKHVVVKEDQLLPLKKELEDFFNFGAVSSKKIRNSLRSKGVEIFDLEILETAEALGYRVNYHMVASKVIPEKSTIVTSMI